MGALFMAVPETSVYENYHPPRRQDHIRPARQLAIMDTVAEAGGEHGFPERSLGFRILSADAGHYLGAFRLGEDVRHQAALRSSKIYVSAAFIASSRAVATERTAGIATELPNCL